MLTLYGSSSPNVTKILIILEELGLSYETRHVSVLRAGQFDPSFLALNPLGRVPVLVDDIMPTPLFESGAILIHLAEREGSPLLPADGPARAETFKWLMFQMSSVGPMLGQRNHFIIMPQERGGYADMRYRDQAERIYRMLDERLAQTPYLAGDDYSIADIATYPWMLYAEPHKVDLARLPNLSAWRCKIAARAAVRHAEATAVRFQHADSEAAAAIQPTDFDRLFWRTRSGPAADLSQLMR
jgi:GST-like protein